MAKITLTNPSDDELNATFAVEIAGWRDVRFEEDEDVDIESRTIYPWKGMAGWPPDGGKRRLIPGWSTYFDAVLPWLTKRDWQAWNQGPQVFVAVYPKKGEGNHSPVGATTLARAATIALLRAHNVEVIFTESTP